MKKRRIGFLGFLLVSIFTLGIGYAALQDYFSITGKLAATANNDNLDCKFVAMQTPGTGIETGVLPEGSSATVEVREMANTTCVVLFTGLSTVGDKAWAYLDVINASEGAVGTELDATLKDLTVTGGDAAYNNHYKVSASWANAEDLCLEAAREGVAAGTNTLKIEVELLVTATSDTEFHTFTVSFSAVTA